MRKIIWAAVVAVALAFAGATVVTPPANAATLKCTVSVENPHFSTGANSVIFKTRITCNIAAVIDFSGTLSKGPQIGPGVRVASTTQTKAQALGKTYTYYTPATGGTKVACAPTAYYSGSIHVVGTAANGVTDTASLATNHVKAC
jgi:hypothetical protein